MKYLLIVFFFLCNISIYAQKEKTIFFGVNVGVKFANKNYAKRYNGLYNNELVNAIYSPINYNEIFIRLGDKNFDLNEVPGNIKYTPGLLTGVLVGYQMSPNLQANIEANFNKLSVKDVFTIIIYDPTNSTSEPTIGLGQIYAKESRFNGRFNFDYVGDGDKAKLILGLSGIFMAWRIDEYAAAYDGYTMPLYSAFNPTNNFGNVTRGSGWGFGTNIGLEYRVNEKIVAQIMYQPYQVWEDFGLTIDKRILLQHDLTVRFLWK